MREILEAVATGELSPEQAQAELAGYATTDAGRFDADREQRRGIPEAIYGQEKTVEEIVDLASTAIKTSERAIITRVDASRRSAIIDQLFDNCPDAEIDEHPRAKMLVAVAPGFQRPKTDARVAVVTAGTADNMPAREAAVTATEMGVQVQEITDVGVASIDRILDQQDALREANVIIVAAGREGALPTVVAGLVDRPVIGLPIASGYGYGGDGTAALMGMLQSCTVLSVVNIDAGFVAGAQAGLIAGVTNT